MAVPVTWLLLYCSSERINGGRTSAGHQSIMPDTIYTVKKNQGESVAFSSMKSKIIVLQHQDIGRCLDHYLVSLHLVPLLLFIFYFKSIKT